MSGAYHIIVGIIPTLERGRDLDFMYVYTDEDAENYQKALEIAKNEVWRTSWDDALYIAGAKDLNEAFTSLSLRTRYSNCEMVCHFIVEEELSRQEMEKVVNSLPMEKLRKAQVNL